MVLGLATKSTSIDKRESISLLFLKGYKNEFRTRECRVHQGLPGRGNRGGGGSTISSILPPLDCKVVG